ncbi:MAG TPA: hypothetical protein VF466_01350 [Candidatus Saccharimonadales bacterium]
MEPSHTKSGSNNKGFYLGIAAVVLVLAAGIGGFLDGVHYGKQHATASGTANTLGADGNGPLTRRFGNGPGGGGGTFRSSGGLGSVTAISASSITIKNDRDGTTKTYAITSSTQIEKDGTIGAYTDITVGATAIVTPDSANEDNALRITLMPASFSGGAGNYQIQTN